MSDSFNKTLKNPDAKSWKKGFSWKLYTYRVTQNLPNGKTRTNRFDVYAPLSSAAPLGIGNRYKSVVDKVTSSTFLALYLKASKPKPSRIELVELYESIASSLRSGGNILDGLETAALFAKSPILRGVIGALRVGMRDEGLSLSASMGVFSNVFGPHVLSLVEAGEAASGKLAEVMQRLAISERKAAKVYRKVVGAMIYPLTMFVFGVVMMVLLQLFALPMMMETYRGLGATEFPWVTEFMVSVSEWIIRNGVIAVPLSLSLLVLAWKGIKWVFSTPSALYVISKVKVVGPIFRSAALARGFRIYLELQKNSVDPEVLYRLVAKSCGNVLYGKYFMSVWNEHKENGLPLEESYALNAYLIGLDGDYVSAKFSQGLRSGGLENVLEHLATDYEEQFDEYMARAPEATTVPLTVLAMMPVALSAFALLLPLPYVLQEMFSYSLK